MMHIRLTIALSAFLALTLSSCAHLPGMSGLEPGQRVRVQVREAEPPRRTGTVIALTADSLALTVDRDGTEGGDGPRVALPVAAIKRVEISTGVRPQTIEGLILGGKVGLIAMLLGTIAGEWVAGDAESFGVFIGCAVTGGAVGTLVRSEDWRRLPLSCIRVSSSPLPEGGFDVGVSVVLRR